MRKICSLIIHFSVIVTLFSCSDTKTGTNVTEFVYNESTGVQSLDPALASYRSAIWIGSQIFNGLIELDSQLNVRPSIAQSWQYDSSGTLLTFHLRSDIRFHDNECFQTKKGRKLTASDIEYSFKRLCDARTKSTGFWVFRDKVIGASEYFEQSQNDKKPASIEGLRAVNDSIFEIRLIQPFAPFLSILTTPFCWIVPHEAVEYYGERFGRNPVGTGPFVFSEWKEDITLSLEKNQHYFKKDAKGFALPYLDKITVGFARNNKSEFFEFSQGKLDFISSIDLSVHEKVFTPQGKLTSEYAKFQLMTASAQSIEYYGIMTDKSLPVAQSVPFCGDKRIRQAMNYAIDRQTIVEYVLKNKAIPAHQGVIPPGFPGYNSQTIGYSYNIAKAKQLLAEAGYPEGKGLPECTLQIGANETTASVAEAIIEQWKQIGIKAKLLQVDFPRHLSMVRSGELALWRTSWIADYSDPENFLGLFYSKNAAPGGPNTTRIAVTIADSLYEAALSPTISQSQRFALYNEMERIILEESPWIFLYYNTNTWLVQPNVHGLKATNPLRLPLEYVKKS